MGYDAFHDTARHCGTGFWAGEQNAYSTSAKIYFFSHCYPLTAVPRALLILPRRAAFVPGWNHKLSEAARRVCPRPGDGAMADDAERQLTGCRIHRREMNPFP